MSREYFSGEPMWFESRMIIDPSRTKQSLEILCCFLHGYCTIFCYTCNRFRLILYRQILFFNIGAVGGNVTRIKYNNLIKYNNFNLRSMFFVF